jgi:acyl-CoA thioesterase FadM
MEPSDIGSRPSASLVELSASVRDVANALLRIDGDPSELAEARRVLDDVAERLQGLGKSSDVPRLGPSADVATTRPYYFPAAIHGSVHVAAPYMTAEQEEARRFGRVRFDLIHEGPPACVHGGHVAWMFDQAFGQHVVHGGVVAGPTYRLEVTYRRPTPVLRELEYEVRTDRIDGRKVFLTAELREGNVVTAEAMGLFVQLKPEASPPGELGDVFRRNR